jgi:hypothetical protein
MRRFTAVGGTVEGDRRRAASSRGMKVLGRPGSTEAAALVGDSELDDEDDFLATVEGGKPHAPTNPPLDTRTLAHAELTPRNPIAGEDPKLCFFLLPRILTTCPINHRLWVEPYPSSFRCNDGPL